MKTLAVLLLIITANSLTNLRAASNSTDLAFEECFKFSSERYGINLNLLKAIALTESNMNPNAINTKSDDYGLMQINKFWLPILKQYGIFKEDLFDPCTNILAGAWILADSISRYGATWEAVGAYNAGTKDTPEVRSRREYYSRKVYKNYVLLGGTP